MKSLTTKLIPCMVLIAALAGLSFGQAAMTTTTLSSAIVGDQAQFTIASATGVVAASGPAGTRTVLYVDQEAMLVNTVSSTTVSVVRGAKGTRRVGHPVGATVYVGPDRQEYFRSGPPRGYCTSTSLLVLPVIEVETGKAWTCTGVSRWGVIKTTYIPPTQCTFAPTTLTTTNTYIQVGASTLFVLNGTSNAAAGTNTLTCNIWTPSIVGTGQGSQIIDIVLLVGSQTTAPTSLGTSTLGSITFPTAATSETASTVTPVAAGGTVTAVSPTQISTVTTAGSFLSIKTTYATPVRLNTDSQLLQYTFPFLQSAAAAMTLNTPGLIVHWTTGGDTSW